VEVTRAAGTLCWKRRLFSILFNVTYSGHRQVGAPMVGNLYTISTKSDMCVYIHIFFTLQRCWLGKRNKKMWSRIECCVPRKSFRVLFWVHIP